jgi:hypothetical protein
MAGHTVRTGIELVPSVRSVDDSSQAQTGFLDLVVDGRSLVPELGRRGYELVTPLWTGAAGRQCWPEEVDRLTGRRPGPGRDGRVALFVCGECGDLGCGAVTVRLTCSDSEVSWADWGFETGRDGEFHRDGLQDLPTYVFDGSAYEATFAAVLSMAD